MRKLKLLCLSKVVMIVFYKNTRKLINHMKQAQNSISNLSNLKKNENGLPLTKKIQIRNIKCLVIFVLSRFSILFFLPNQVDLSAHFFYHFSTSWPGTILSWRLIMKIISTVILLPSADLFKKGCCQLQAKVCAQITG